MSPNILTTLNRAEPHAVRAWVVKITAVDTTSGTCTIDPQDGELAAEVPYWGAAPAVGSVQVAFLFDGLLGVLVAGGAATVADPALPDPVTNGPTSDIVITTGTRHQEPAVSTRVSITNPHPTRSLMCHGWSSAWMSCTAITSATQVYLDVDPLGSTMDEAGPPGSPMIPTHVRWDLQAPPPATSLRSGLAQAYYYIPPASTGTIFASGARAGTGLTYTMRNVYTSLIPIRYA